MWCSQPWFRYSLTDWSLIFKQQRMWQKFFCDLYVEKGRKVLFSNEKWNLSNLFYYDFTSKGGKSQDQILWSFSSIGTWHWVRGDDEIMFRFTTPILWHIWHYWHLSDKFWKFLHSYSYAMSLRQDCEAGHSVRLINQFSKVEYLTFSLRFLSKKLLLRGREKL